MSLASGQPHRIWRKMQVESRLPGLKRPLCLGKSDENAKASGGVYGDLFRDFIDRFGKENFARTSIFRGAKVQHMAAEAAGLLSKEDGEEESSLESEGGCEEEDDDDMDSELQAHARESSKIATNDRANDGECLTQEEMVVSSGNQNPLSSFNLTTGNDMPCSNAQHPSMGIGGLEESCATKSCACSFCVKGSFMLTDLHYQDARSQLAGGSPQIHFLLFFSISSTSLKKNIKFTRSLGAKSQRNEYPFNAYGYNLKQAGEMEFELSQQQRSLFLHTENVLVRESAQLHSAVVKLKDLRENCRTDLNMIINSLLGK